MTAISIKHVSKRYGDFVAVDDVNLEIADGEFMVLVGPSGSGKSTLLRMIVGLEDISDGDLYFGDQRVNDRAPRDRDLAMVFQDYALYPHLTVYENIAFPLRLQKVGGDEVDKRVRSVADRLELTEFLDRKPANLSGGQRQRVAMGRAVIRDAHAFLFDEPLSNLDAKLRVQVRTQIARLQNQLGTTTVYVTHDQVEAMTLGDRVALLRRGTLQQVGSPRDLYAKPSNLFVAGFMGSPPMNLLPAEIHPDHLSSPFGDIPFDAARLPASLAGKDVIIIGIRPEELADASLLDDEQRGRGATLSGRIDVLEWLGNEQLAYLPFKAPDTIHQQLTDLQKELDSESDQTQLIVALPDASKAREGDEIRLWLDPDDLHLFDPATTENVTLRQKPAS